MKKPYPLRAVKPPIERFMKHVIPEPMSGCWLWTAGTTQFGYGHFSLGRASLRPRWQDAHRFSYQHFVGPITNGLHVLHHCDVPACVNPEHLYLGTPTDNAHDTLRRGRRTANKLNPQAVIEIRSNCAGRKAMRKICAKYNIGPSTFYRIRHNQCWRYVKPNSGALDPPLVASPDSGPAA